MCEERVIETLLAAIARRDETIRENVAALRAAVRREERDHEEVADLRERIEDFRKRLAVCCEESENRLRQIHELTDEIHALLDQISKERLAHEAEISEANATIARMRLEGTVDQVYAELLARGLAFALAIAEYRAASEIKIVPWNECPECGGADPVARFLCGRCRATGEYCSRDEEGCSRLAGHTGPCRKRDRR